MNENITKRKLEEAARIQSEALLRQAQRMARLGYYVLDIATGSFTTSAMLDEILGIPPDTPRTVEGWLGLVHPEDRTRMQEHLSVHVLRDRRPFDSEYRIQRPGSEAITWVHAQGELELDGQGTPVRIFGTLQDITDKKTADRVLRETSDRFIKAFNNTPVGMTITTLGEGRLIEFNATFLRTMGYTREDALGKTVHELKIYARQEDRDTLVRLIRENGAVHNQEIPVRTRTGEIRQGLLSAEIIELDGQKVLLTVLADITEQKMAEGQRKKLEQQLNQIQRLESLGVLAGGIAHDFNNLLSGIFGYVDLARGVARDAQVLGYLDAMMRSMDRARELTRQLLTFAKGGAPVLKAEPLTPFLRDAVSFALSGSNITCSYELARDLFCASYDRNQMAQVIDNLIINAEQAMPRGGSIRIKAENVTLACNEHASLPAGKYVQIAFTDNGIGIPREIQPRIFDPFFTTKPKGSGLGLATCYSIIHRHGGCLEVESEPEKGATFRLLLPACEPSERPAQLTEERRFRGGGKILLMDDDEVIRQTIGVMLSRLGYECVPAPNGQVATEILSRTRQAGDSFAAVFLDLTVPGGMGGLETAREIRARDERVPIFVISGYAEDPVISDPRGYGFTDSLGKPFCLADLTGLLARHLPGRP